eukprot:242479-Prorocentrum_minimum.AAC.1
MSSIVDYVVAVLQPSRDEMVVDGAGSASAVSFVPVQSEGGQIAPGKVVAVYSYSELGPGGDHNVDCISKVPYARWDVNMDSARGEAMLTRRFGCFLEDVAGFDTMLFSVSDNEASIMDPQQRLLLHACLQTLHQSDLYGKSVEAGSTSVMVGIAWTEYARLSSDSADGAA